MVLKKDKLTKKEKRDNVMKQMRNAKALRFFLIWVTKKGEKMKITVEELLKMKEFSRFKVLCGAGGLNKEVRSVSVMDAPDIYKWIRGGEILLTSGYVLKDNMETMPNLIQELTCRGAAALFIKLGRFVDEIPKSVTQTATRLDFPIVYMPYEFTFVDVITPTLTRVNTYQLEQIRHSEKIHRIFISIAIKQEGIKKIIEYLSNLIEQDVVYYSVLKLKGVHFYTNGNTVFDHEHFMSKYPCFAVNLNGKICGYVIVVNEKYKAEKYDLIAIDHAITVIKLDVQKQTFENEVERKYKDNFVLDLIFNTLENMDEIETRGKTFGWHFSGEYYALIADIDHFKAKYVNEINSSSEIDRISREMTDCIIEKVTDKFTGCVYTTFTEQVIFIIHKNGLEHGDLTKRLNEVNEGLKKDKGFTAVFSFGSRAIDISEVYISYRQAKTALKLARHLKREGCVCFYSELGIYKLLDKIKNDAYVEKFSEECLRKLIIYDFRNNSDLYKTLEELVRYNWNLKETAENMYVHYNTMKKRYHKIQEILGVSFQNPGVKMEMEFAVKIKLISEKS